MAETPADISIVAEHHDNLSGIREMMNQAREAPAGTRVMLELPALMNGPIEAFYRDEIAQSELQEIMRGYFYQRFEDRADDMTAAIAELKERGIPAIAYDVRDLVSGFQSGHDQLTEYSARKNEQIAQERAATNDQIAEMRMYADASPAGSDARADYLEDITALQTQRDTRTAMLTHSLDRIIELAPSSAMNTAIEAYAYDDIIDHTRNADVLAAEVISGFHNGHSIVFLGESHVSGEYAPDNQYQAYGIVDESLEALGHTVRVTAVRSSVDGFVQRAGNIDMQFERRTADDYAHLVVNEQTGERGAHFANQSELRDAVLATADSEHAAAIERGEYRIGMVNGTDTPLPQADQSVEFGDLLRGLSMAPKMDFQDLGQAMASPEGRQNVGEQQQRNQGQGAVL